MTMPHNFVRCVLRWVMAPIFIGAFALLISGRAVQAQSGPAAVETLFLPLIDAESAALCRLGVNGDIRSIDPGLLRLGWYVDYGATLNAVKPANVRYMPMIRLVQTNTGPRPYRYSLSANHAPTTEQQLLDVIAANPGAEWFIGNEPDRRLLQDDIEPHIYAIAYHDLYHLIKNQDPTAKIIAGSIVQATEIRLQYLDMVLEAYRTRYGEPMPVDVWALHNFILNEASCAHFPESECWGAGIPPGIDAKEGLRVLVRDNDSFDLFKQQILRFRQWLVDRGYGGAPVYLSEYGVLMPNIFAPPDDFPPDRVNRFMNQTFDYILKEAVDPQLGDPNDGYRLIQRLSWYSVTDQAFNGYLFQSDSNSNRLVLSPMGQNFSTYAASIAKQVDFYPVHASIEAPPVPDGENTVDITLRAIIANSGNNAAAQTARVRFYNGNPAGSGVQIGADQIVSLEGCGANQIASVVWQDAPLGAHNLFVVVEPSSGLDNNPENNTLRFSLYIGRERLYLPTLGR